MTISKLEYTEERTINDSKYRMEILQIYEGEIKGVKWCMVYELKENSWVLLDNFQAAGYDEKPHLGPQIKYTKGSARNLATRTNDEIAEESWPLFKVN